MSKWVHADVLDNGPVYIKTNCNKMAVISAYTLGDSYATVNAAIIAEATMSSSDFTMSSSGSNRVLTTATGKSDASANTSASASHLAFVDTVNSKVLWVTTETSGQSITAGNTVNFPSVTYTVNQPT